MYKQVDTSELDEHQKLSLVLSYFDELAKIYKKRAEVAVQRSEPINDLVNVLFAKEEDVLKLKQWVSANITQNHARKLGEYVSQSTPKPTFTIDQLRADVTGALLNLQAALNNMPPARPPYDMLRTVVDTTLMLLRSV